MMRTGMIETGSMYSAESEQDLSDVMHQIDAGHFELVSTDDEPTAAGDDPSGTQQDEDTETATADPVAGDAATKRKGGRPKGSKNKSSVPPPAPKVTPEVVIPDGNDGNTDKPEDAPSGV